ncbi:GATA transcription factor 5 [Striga hermonthica]|uniref:GATA transcription factor 5 n=1 Tax=Striga hermonthica TaxID=68872 RepID=A0A9N7MV27_STRHE|nr:GATA transcription factor 5 [Striga hermonthica]
MLNRTQRHHHFSLQIQSFSPSPLHLTTQEMEPVYGSGFDPNAAKITAAVCDLTGGGPGDDLFVDGLLDFSNGFSETEEPPFPPPSAAGDEHEKRGIAPVSHEKQEPPAPENCSFVAGDDFGSLHESELSFQGESLESLEWLSHIVEDSFPDYSLAGKFPAVNRFEQPPPPLAAECFATPVQTKARTKRARTGVRVWPVLSPSFAEPDTSSSSSASSATSSLPPSKRRARTAAGGGAAAALRRCTHCGVTRTPQWRAGPCGPKTLCNACGVRYKSGRLLPEYRPACSPTFSIELHSNNHRKVMEMRRMKEVETEGTGLPPPVQSF